VHAGPVSFRRTVVCHFPGPVCLSTGLGAPASGTPAEGQAEGDIEGDIDEDADGETEADGEGQAEGQVEGDIEGDIDEDADGETEGDGEGDGEGQAEGEEALASMSPDRSPAEFRIERDCAAPRSMA
jgi:hypothetical protein